MAFIKCPECGKKISDQAASCPNCGMPMFRESACKSTKTTSGALQNDDLLHCPKCRSTNLHTSKKGFSGGKALAGAIVTGGIGILAGTIGSHDIEVTCLKCGCKFNPVKDLKKEEKEKEQGVYREIRITHEANGTAIKRNIIGEIVFCISLLFAFALLFVSGISIWWSVFLPILGLIFGAITGKMQGLDKQHTR